MVILKRQLISWRSVEKIGDKIQVTKDSIDTYQQAFEALNEDRDILVNRMKRFPLELRFGKFRCVLHSVLELDELLENLKGKIENERR
jgi:hypothetical protein